MTLEMKVVIVYLLLSSLAGVLDAALKWAKEKCFRSDHATLTVIIHNTLHPQYSQHTTEKEPTQHREK